MPAIALQDIDQLPDVLLTDRFELLIQPVGTPTGLRDLTLRCQSVSFPGSNIEDVPVGLQGFTFYYRGRKMFSGMLSATYVETHDAPVWQALKTWQETVVGTLSGSGLSKRGYVATGSLIVYDERGEASLSAKIYNMWPQDVPDVQLDGQASMAFLVPVTFKFDWCTFDNVVPG